MKWLLSITGMYYIWVFGPHCVHLFIRSNPFPLPMDIARPVKGSSSHIVRDRSFLDRVS